MGEMRKTYSIIIENLDGRRDLGDLGLDGRKILKEPYINRSRDSVVGIATGYGLDDRGVEVRVPVGSRIFLLHVLQTGSGAHPDSYPMGTGDSFPGDKAVGA
jgi:hypothetical protein